MLVPATVVDAVAKAAILEKQAAVPWGTVGKYMARALGGGAVGYGVGSGVSTIGGYNTPDSTVAPLSKLVHTLEGIGLATIPGAWSGHMPKITLGALAAEEVAFQALHEAKQTGRAFQQGSETAAAAQNRLADAVTAAGTNIGGLGGDIRASGDAQADATRSTTTASLMANPAARGAAAGALLAALIGGGYGLNRPLTERERLQDKSRARVAVEDAGLAAIPGALAGGVIGHLMRPKS